MTSTFKCLIKDTPSWHVVMSTNLKNPKVQDSLKKGTLSNQPRLTPVTPTALLGSWVLQPIKDMTSLGTDFETHANWQGYLELPAAKNFASRKICTIALNKLQGTHWNVIKCQECLGNWPEAVIRQTTININSQVWKSLEDSLPKLDCVDLAEAYVMQESVSLRILCEKKRYDLVRPMDVHMRNLWQKAERGKKPCTDTSSRILQHLASRKCGMGDRNMGAHV
jgi:hypothetical protein